MSFLSYCFHLPFYAVHVQFVGTQRPVANPSCDLASYAWSVVVKIPYERSRPSREQMYSYPQCYLTAVFSLDQS